MSNDRKLKSLKVRQKSLITSLNLIKLFVDGYDEETQADEVPVRLERLTKLWADYNEVQNELETLDEAALETLLEERSKLETAYYRIKGFLLAHNKSPLNETLSPINPAPPQSLPSASQDLTAFLQRRVTVLQSIQPSKPTDAQPTSLSKKPGQRPVSSHGANQAATIPRKCIICSGHHPLYLCEAFSKLSTDQKEVEVNRHQLCRNCLRQGHFSSLRIIFFLQKMPRTTPHPALHDWINLRLVEIAVHRTPSINSTTTTSSPANHEPSTSASATITEAVSCASAGDPQKTILLATAVINIIDDDGVKHVARALLDSGSECCFITERLSHRIKAHRKNIHLPITGIGQASTHAKQKFLTRIRSRVGEYSTNVEFLVLPSVTIDLPATSVDTSSWDMPPGIHLADPTFADTNPVDVIIGAEIFFELFRVPGRIALGHNQPVLVNSVFGWVVSGKSTTRPSTPIVAHLATITAYPTGLPENLSSTSKMSNAIPVTNQLQQSFVSARQTTSRGNDPPTVQHGILNQHTSSLASTHAVNEAHSSIHARNHLSTTDTSINQLAIHRRIPQRTSNRIVQSVYDFPSAKWKSTRNPSTTLRKPPTQTTFASHHRIPNNNDRIIAEHSAYRKIEPPASALGLHLNVHCAEPSIDFCSLMSADRSKTRCKSASFFASFTKATNTVSSVSTNEAYPTSRRNWHQLERFRLPKFPQQGHSFTGARKFIHQPNNSNGRRSTPSLNDQESSIDKLVRLFRKQFKKKRTSSTTFYSPTNSSSVTLAGNQLIETASGHQSFAKTSTMNPEAEPKMKNTRPSIMKDKRLTNSTTDQNKSSVE
nr:uncharacterized protein LOC115261124 [Aedes albopictus]